MATRIEYAAYYPFQLIPDTEWVYYGPVDREDAMQMVQYVNARAKQAGVRHRALLMQRTVEIGEWEPTNTGIIPPHITERIKKE